MKITAWKFGKDNLTVKYENSEGAYTLKTGEEPKESLYKAAVEVAEYTKAELGFNFDVSFSAINISYGKNPTAAIVLNTVTSTGEIVEVKCPKINRKQHFDETAKTQTLPGMDANTVCFVYNSFSELNLAIDVFLKEAEAFVLSKPKREPTLFDELDISESEDEDDEE
jgi:hypothetical protein